MRCKECEYWKDYNDRVYACISNVKSGLCRDDVELRACKFRPSPNIERCRTMYTDKDYECSDGIPKKD